MVLSPRVVRKKWPAHRINTTGNLKRNYTCSNPSRYDPFLPSDHERFIGYRPAAQLKDRTKQNQMGDPTMEWVLLL